MAHVQGCLRACRQGPWGDSHQGAGAELQGNLGFYI